MPSIKKARAGSDSFGHVWPEDGSVVDVPADEAAVLLRIPDGGFTDVSAPEPEPQPLPDPEPAPEAEPVTASARRNRQAKSSASADN